MGAFEAEAARVVAVTAARVGTAKRGVAAGVARGLARLGAGRVCILDADVTTRDVSVRFGVEGPTAADVLFAIEHAGDADPLQDIARDADGCLVVPVGASNDTLDASVFARLILRLRAHVEYLVVDTPVGLGMYARRVDHLIATVDELLVATTTQPEDVPALMHYLNTITRARVTGEIPPTVELRVVPTGEGVDDDEPPALSRKLPSVPVSDVLPQLWGRNAGLIDPDADALPETLANLVRELVR
jgi:MinD-like ATPase involved in chromosome partitioning or flagellar assembly